MRRLSSVKWYDGQHLAANSGAIVVSLNYRLGPLGFLATPELKKRYGTSGGMNGIRDQVTALKWVQKHISAFGGDPSRVTLTGESSGGISVCILNTAPAARGLFHRAVVQSGPCIVPSSGWGPHTPQYGYEKASRLMRDLNASNVDELRQLPPQLLQWDNETLGSDNFAGYFFDDGWLSEWPMAMYTSGRLNAVGGMIIGHTSKDGTASFYGTAPLANATPAEWRAAMQRRWGAMAPEVMQQYSLARFSGANASKAPAVSQSYIEADADNRVACPLRTMARLAAKATPVYTYVFAHCQLICDAGFEMGVLPSSNRSALAGCGWASHGSENKFLFMTTHGCDSLANPPFPRQDCPFDAGERHLSAHMGGRWADFAKGDAPWWPFVEREAALPTIVGVEARNGHAESASCATCPQHATPPHTAQRGLRWCIPWAPAVDFKRDDCAFWDGAAKRP